MRERNWANRFADATDLQDTSLPGLPLIEIAGNIRVLMEHHCGVKEYGRQRIVIQTKDNLVAVEGDGLELTKMTPQQLIVSGTIHSVTLLGR